MSARLGWAITIWLALALIAICLCAGGCIALPVLWPVLVGLGVPAGVLLWHHRELLQKLLSSDRS